MAVIRKPPTGASSLKKINRNSPPEPRTFTGEEFYSETEHGHNYVRHPVSSRYQPPKTSYVPNNNKLDPTTNHHADYRPWPITIPERHQVAKFEPNHSEFAFTESTSKADYNTKPLPPPQRRVQKFVNSAANMGFSTGSSLNLSHGTAVNSSSSNAINSNLDESAGSETEFKGGYARNRAKFDSTTSQKDDFKPWPITTPTRHQQQKYAPNANSTLTGMTTQQADFTPKPLGEHYVHPHPVYQKTGSPLETITTHKASFLKWQVELPQKYKNMVAPKPGQSSVINIGNH